MLRPEIEARSDLDVAHKHYPGAQLAEELDRRTSRPPTVPGPGPASVG